MTSLTTLEVIIYLALQKDYAINIWCFKDQKITILFKKAIYLKIDFFVFLSFI